MYTVHTHTHTRKQTGIGNFPRTPTKISSNFNTADAAYLPLIVLPLI